MVIIVIVIMPLRHDKSTAMHKEAIIDREMLISLPIQKSLHALVLSSDCQGSHSEHILQSYCLLLQLPKLVYHNRIV